MRVTPNRAITPTRRSIFARRCGPGDWAPERLVRGTITTQPGPTCANSSPTSVTSANRLLVPAVKPPDAQAHNARRVLADTARARPDNAAQSRRSVSEMRVRYAASRDVKGCPIRTATARSPSHPISPGVPRYRTSHAGVRYTQLPERRSARRGRHDERPPRRGRRRTPSTGARGTRPRPAGPVPERRYGLS